MYMNKIKKSNPLIGLDPYRFGVLEKSLDMKGVCMCKAMEDMRNQTLKEGMVNVAKRMLAAGTLSLEKIAEYAGLSLDEVKKLKADKTA